MSKVDKLYKRWHLRLVFIIIYIFFSTTVSAKELKKVTLQLSWFDQFQFAGYYMAKEKGFYKKLGLDVEIKAFDFGVNVPDLVDKKEADFGIGRETLILDRVSGKKIVALYALFQSSPLVLLSTKKSGINSIDDFKNKRVMTTIDDAGEVSIKAMITSKKLKMDEFTFLKHTHNINDLIDNKTDIISAYISKSPFDLQKNGIAYNIFSPRDYGFDMYSDLLFTNQDLIEKDIDTVLAFKKASLKGWKYAYENINEAVELILKNYNPQKISKEALIYEAQELKKLSYYKTKSLGDIDKAKIQRIYDLYNVMGLISNPQEIKDFVFYKDNNEHIFLTENEKEYLRKNKKIKMCVIPNFKPYSYIDENKFKGFVADYFKKVEKKTGFKFELVQTNTISQSIDLLKNKKCDIISSLKDTKSRREFMNFTKSYSSLPVVLVTKSNFPYVNSLEVLENKKIALIKDIAMSKELKNRFTNLKFLYVKDTKEGIEKVLNNKIDAHLDFLYSSLYQINEKANPNLKISNISNINFDVSIAVKKDELTLLSILNKVIDEISDKEKDEIIKKWISIEYKESLNYKYFIWIFIFLLIVFFLLLYRQELLEKVNKSLNKKVEEKNQELLKINSSLEKRVKEEVEKNLDKDRILERQAKMAAMGEMIENIAHQWRQPLSVISTGASGIKIKKEINDLSDEFLDEHLNIIIESSKYLSHTIDDFRFFFKPNKEKKQFCIKNCVEKSLTIVSPKLNNSNIKIIKNLISFDVLNYETELIQVLINILNNSKDALDITSNKEKLIFIDTKNFNDKLLIKISDNAGGINENIIDKIFEPYFTTKHKNQGTGIGLYMCEQIITKHMNGLIEVSNTDIFYNDIKYKGSQFTIILYNE